MIFSIMLCIFMSSGLCRVFWGLICHITTRVYFGLWQPKHSKVANAVKQAHGINNIWLSTNGLRLGWSGFVLEAHSWKKLWYASKFHILESMGISKLLPKDIKLKAPFDPKSIRLIKIILKILRHGPKVQ